LSMVDRCDKGVDIGVRCHMDFRKAETVQRLVMEQIGVQEG